VLAVTAKLRMSPRHQNYFDHCAEITHWLLEIAKMIGQLFVKSSANRPRYLAKTRRATLCESPRKSRGACVASSRAKQGTRLPRFKTE